MLLLYYLVTLVVTSSLLADSFGNPHKIEELVGVSSANLMLPALIVLIVLRLKVKNNVLNRWSPIMAISVLGLSCLTVVLTIFDVVTYPNAAFSLTRLHQDSLLLLMLFVGFLTVLSQTNHWWARHWKKVVFWFPFVAFVVAGLVRAFPFDVFKEIVKEDKLVENLQFLVLLSGSAVSWWLSKKAFKKKQVLTFFFCFLGIGFALVAGDEVAWGQRFFGIEVNQTVKQLNRQEELTVHNLHTVEWMVAYGYAALALVGTCGWLLIQKLPLKRRVKKIFNHTMLVGYFCIPLVFYIAQLLVPGGIWHSWSEVSELYLYSGIVLSVALLGYEKVVTNLS